MQRNLAITLSADVLVPVGVSPSAGIVLNTMLCMMFFKYLLLIMILGPHMYVEFIFHIWKALARLFYAAYTKRDGRLRSLGAYCFVQSVGPLILYACRLIMRWCSFMCWCNYININENTVWYTSTTLAWSYQCTIADFSWSKPTTRPSIPWRLASPGYRWPCCRFHLHEGLA